MTHVPRILPIFAKACAAEPAQNTVLRHPCQGESPFSACQGYGCQLPHRYTACMDDVRGDCHAASCNYWHGFTEVRQMLEARDVGPQLDRLTTNKAHFGLKCAAHVCGAVSRHLMRCCTTINESHSSSAQDTVDSDLKYLAQQYNAVIHTFNDAPAVDVALYYRCARRFLNPLPLLSARDAVVKACTAKKSFLLLESSTGSGKSTQVPQYLAECAAAEAVRSGGTRKLVICVEPRAVAAWTLAERVAQEYDGVFARSGRHVRHWTRSSHRYTPRDECHILYTTEHALLSLWENKTLNFNTDVYAVVLDEAHERSIVGDMLLALLKERVLQTRSFCLVVCSATLQTGLYDKYLPDACVIRSDRREHPVTVLYTPMNTVMSAEADYVSDTVTAIVSAVEDPVKLSGAPHVTSRPAQRHILVFLPSADDVEQASDILAKRIASKRARRATVKDEAAESEGDSDSDDVRHADDKHAPNGVVWENVEVCLISGRQDARTQKEAFKEVKPHIQKVILATPVAETSVTIDGVGLVIDSGFTRTVTYDPVAKVSRHEVSPVTQSAATQRAGRAGRTGPGLCIRLYSQPAYDLLAKDKPAALRTAPLHMASLQLAQLRRTMETFDWLERPSPEAVKATLDELCLHGAFGPAAVPGGPPALSDFGQFLLRMEHASVPIGKLLFDAERSKPRDDAFLAVVSLMAAVMHGSLGLFYCPRKKAADFDRMLQQRGKELEALECGDVICTASLVAQVLAASRQPNRQSQKQQQRQPHMPADAPAAAHNNNNDEDDEDDDEDEDEGDESAKATAKTLCEANFLRWRAVCEVRKEQCTFFRQARDARPRGPAKTVVPTVTCAQIKQHAADVQALLASSFCLQLALRRGDEKLDYQTVDASQSDCLMVNRSFMKQQCTAPSPKNRNEDRTRTNLKFDAYKLPPLCVFARVVSYAPSCPAFISLCTPVKQEWLPASIQASVKAARARQAVVRTMPLPSALLDVLRPAEVKQWLSHKLDGAECKVIMDYGKSELVLYCDRRTASRAAAILSRAVETAKEGHSQCCYEVPLHGFCRVALGSGGTAREVLRNKDEYVTLVFSAPAEPGMECLQLYIPELVATWSHKWFARIMPVTVRDSPRDGNWKAQVTFASSKDARDFYKRFEKEDIAERPFITVQPYCEQTAVAAPIEEMRFTCDITVRILWGQADRGASRTGAGTTPSREAPLEAVLRCQQLIASALPKEAKVLSNSLDTRNKLLYMHITAPNDRIAELTLQTLHRIRGPSFHYQDMFISAAFTAEFPLDPLINKFLQQELRSRIMPRTGAAAKVLCDTVNVDGRRALLISCDSGKSLTGVMEKLQRMTEVHALNMKGAETASDKANRARAVAFQSRRLVELFNRDPAATSKVLECQLQFREADESFCFIGEESSYNALQQFLDATTALNRIACVRLMVHEGPKPRLQSRAWFDAQIAQCRSRKEPIRAIRHLNTITLIAPTAVVTAARTDAKVKHLWRMIDDKEMEVDGTQASRPNPPRIRLGADPEEDHALDTEEEDDDCGICFCPLTPDRIRLTCCHRYCTECLKGMFNVEGGDIPSLPIKCTSDNCQLPLSVSEVVRIATVSSLANLGTAGREKLLAGSIQDGVEIKACPNKLCLGVPTVVTFDKRECAGCLLRYCEICSGMGYVCAWHDGQPHKTLAQMSANELLKKLTLLSHCPKCDEAFYDFNGCFAISCSRGHGFCGFCMQDCGGDAHDHVRGCARNPAKGGYHAPVQQFYRCRAEDLANEMMAVLRASPAYSLTLVDALVDLVKKYMSDDWPCDPIDRAQEELRADLTSASKAPVPARTATSKSDGDVIPNTAATAAPTGRIGVAQAAVAALRQYRQVPSDTSSDTARALWAACRACNTDLELFLASAHEDVEEAAVELYIAKDNAHKIIDAMRNKNARKDIATGIPTFVNLVLSGLCRFRRTQPVTAYYSVPWTAQLATALRNGERVYWEAPTVCARTPDTSTRQRNAPRRLFFTVQCTLYAEVMPSKCVVLPAGVHLRVITVRQDKGETVVDLQQESDFSLENASTEQRGK